MNSIFNIKLELGDIHVQLNAPYSPQTLYL